MKRFFEFVIVVIVIFVAVVTYYRYWDDVVAALFVDDPYYTVHIGEVAVKVTVADEPDERMQGLSGVSSLGDFEGKLFIFEQADYHGFWMKEMLFALDILWFDEDLRLVHIEKNVSPTSYPKIFGPDEPARFALELNGRFVDTLRIEEGMRLNLPSTIIPGDIKERLRN